MGGIQCHVCGEEWDNEYITHLPPTPRATFRLGLGCPKCRKRDVLSEKEKILVRASIEEVLNTLSIQFILLTSKTGGTIRTLEPQLEFSELFTLLEQFFTSCQTAEDRIKIAYWEGKITTDEVDAYHTSIGKEVDIVLGISNNYPNMTEMIRFLVETKPSVMDIIRSLSNPDARQFLKRKYSPLDISLDVRYGKERGR